MRRGRLNFEGKLCDPRLEYRFQLGLAARDLDESPRVPLLDSYVTFAAHRDIRLRVGQFEIPFGRPGVLDSESM